MESIGPMVEEILFDASFEVVHEFVSEMAAN
jgi:hypothetical protein